MFSLRTFASLTLAASLFPACAHDQPLQAPTRADVGDVHLTETIQDCFVNRSADEWVPTTPDEIYLKVNLLVDNTSQKSTILFPGRLRMSDAKLNQEVAPDQVVEALSIPPGEKRQVAIEFRASGDFTCHDPFSLKVAGAVEEAGRPLALSH